MKYGKIFDYRNRHEAKAGRRYVFSDFLEKLVNLVNVDEHHSNLGRLCSISAGERPFMIDGGRHYQFIREVIEEPELMTYRQLAEWLAKRNGLALDTDSDVATNSFMYPIAIENKQLSGDVLLVRPWDSDEWVVPTVDIYEAFCRPKCKEDE